MIGARKAFVMHDVPRLSRRVVLRSGICGLVTATILSRFPILENFAALPGGSLGRNTEQQNACLFWNTVALQCIRDLHPCTPMTARALAIMNTCMYDAWSVYDSKAAPTQRTMINKQTGGIVHKQEAISYAAYRALLDLFPGEATLLENTMHLLHYDASNITMDTATPAGIGNVSAQAILVFRHQDGSNQANGYADTTSFPHAYREYPAVPLPLNTPDAITNPNHWQPLRIADSNGGVVVQTYVGPHWGLVLPFALRNGAEFRPQRKPLSTQFGEGISPAHSYVQQAQQMVDMSAHLTDNQKAIAEYWRDGPHSEQPPGHWVLFGQWLSARDHHTLDQDIPLFFALTNALFDASIAAWDAKRFYTSERPITAIRYLFQGKNIAAWAGPCRGTQQVLGEQWLPYQPATIVTPPFPEYVSGHSTFSAAAAEILKRITHSDRFGYSVTIPAHSSLVEPCTPSTTISLAWDSFTDAADQAGLSRRYGGIHFRQGDWEGRRLGRQVGVRVWEKVQEYLAGRGASEAR